MADVGGADDRPMHEILSGVIHGIYSPSSRIVAVESYRQGYLPYPARLTIETLSGVRTACVVKASTSIDRITHEAHVLRALTELGFPVPNVLAGPDTVEHQSKSLAILVMSELTGEPLPWLGLTDLNTANRTGYLVQAAVDTLHAATPKVRTHPIADRLPSVTIESELQTIVERGGPWFDVPLFREAVELLKTAPQSVATPLVFSNGDYNPLNFLHVAETITGWLDFEAARFEDPYIGFAKFLLWADDDYGWGAGAKVGLVERYLFVHNVAPSAFLPRLVLRGLTHVQSYSPAQPPRHVLQVIESAVNRLKLLHNS